jgi:small-conductance mechanosensitive channel
MTEAATSTTSTSAAVGGGPSSDPLVGPLIEGLRILRDLVVVGPEERLFWMTTALVAIAGGWFLNRLVRGRSRRHPVRKAVSTFAAFLRGLSVVLVSILLLSLIPAWLAPAFLLAAAAASAAVGWSLRDILPDVVAALWFVVERRIQTGAAIQGGENEGVIERLGLRSAWIRTPDGRRRLVPNRRLLHDAFRVEPRRWPRARVQFVLQEPFEPVVVRRVVREAVLSSPLVPVEPNPRVERSPQHPDQWVLTVRLIDLSLRSRFEGELLERIESVLSRETAPRRSA